ncbi:MAG: CcmD family protein [Ferruginibacter sp.]
MRNKVYWFLLLLTGLFNQTVLYAQSKDMGEGTMRSNGKIYVVMAICITILAGLLLYLVRIDRKIAKIEDKH